ncbi:MAG TPA: TfoX/Sxy family protein [Kofleriaceae bacterium]
MKIPKENHPLLLAALPKDPRVRTLQMFGAVAATVNGNLFGGLFARSAIVKLGDEDLREALALDGAEPFDPMGNKRVMSNTVLLPETVMDEPDELKRWLARGLAYTATLPAKQKKASAKPAKQAAAKKSAAKKVPAKQPTKKVRAKPAKKSARAKR